MTIDTSNDAKISPMMIQWHACKKQAGTALLLFRLGDFYEAFYDDAILLSKELDLTLTKRQDIPMAGIPFHTSDTYVDRLVGKGYRVAIAEQMEDPKQVKGLVKREIVRIVTPGSVVTSSLLSEKNNNYLACLIQVNQILGLALLDLTTAEFRVYEFEHTGALLDELARLRPKELLLSEKTFEHQKSLLEECKKDLSFVFVVKEDWHFAFQHCHDYLIKHFSVHSLDGFGLKPMHAATIAAGSLLIYVQEELSIPLKHVQSLQKETTSSYMSIDSATLRHLELIHSLHDKQDSFTLLHFLDKTSTPMGGRLLKQWIMHPLLEVDAILQRQEALSFFLSSPAITLLPQKLEQVRDLERLIMRVETGYASPRDLVAVKLSLEQIPHVLQILQNCSSSYLHDALDKLFDASEIVALIQKAIVNEPPFRLSDGNVFKRGYDDELDELKNIQSHSSEWIARYQTSLRESANIKTLKVGYTKAFGYYIEVSRGQADKIPPFFQRRQTLVNAERFVTDELKEFEHKILSAEEKIAAKEQALFSDLKGSIAAKAAPIRQMASSIARIDCILSLALIAKAHRFTRPIIDESDIFHVEEGRHPVIESSLISESFIPNDVFMDSETQRLLLITGPNMAGKSTYIRQVALLAILAQMGSFLPAKKAHIGIIDKVFSRIGASDNLSRGQSTFMVEMTETANILHNVTPKSLVILDEIGRGTSTYDGISIAWAVAQYLLTTKGKTAKTLFATHYCELTELEKLLPGAVNYHIAVHESDKGIIFLRKIVRGGTDKSYGIHVARLAGLPLPVIKRAEEILHSLETSSSRKPSPSAKPQRAVQLSLFPEEKPSPNQPVIDEIKQIDPHHLTPIEALRKIAEWKGKVL